MRPALLLVLACTAAPPAVVLPAPTHAVADGPRTLSWLAWAPDPGGGTLTSWTPLQHEGQRLLALTTTRFDRGTDGHLRAWTRTGPTCLDEALRPVDAPCASRTVRWVQEIAPDHTSVWWTTASGTTLPPARLPRPLAALWWPPEPGRPVAWLDPAEGRVHEVELSPEGAAVLPGQRWSYVDGTPVSVTLPHGWRLVPASEAPADDAPADELRVPANLPDPGRLHQLLLRADDGRELTLHRRLREEVPPTAGTSDEPCLPLDPPRALPAEPPTAHVLTRVERTVRRLRARVQPVRLTATPDADLTWTEARGDCDDLSALLVATLGHQDIQARRVTGWVYSPSPTAAFTRHAWVEVAQPGGWWPVDPALGQTPADLTHVADAAWGADGPPRSFEVVSWR